MFIGLVYDIDLVLFLFLKFHVHVYCVIVHCPVDVENIRHLYFFTTYSINHGKNLLFYM